MTAAVTSTYRWPIDFRTRETFVRVFKVIGQPATSAILDEIGYPTLAQTPPERRPELIAKMQQRAREVRS